VQSLLGYLFAGVFAEFRSETAKQREQKPQQKGNFWSISLCTGHGLKLASIQTRAVDWHIKAVEGLG